MDADEQAIRSLVDTWARATTANDLNRVLELMDDDVVFLGAGRPPMRGKDAFAAASRQHPGHVEGHVDIQEIRIFGDWAYCWNQLSVHVRQDGGEDVHLTGPVLSVLRRLPSGRWVIVRDANMITPSTRARG